MSDPAGPEPVLLARLEQLEARVRQLEDERAVRELLARFSFLEDSMRDDEWVELWTDDGVYDMAAVVAGPDGTALTLTRRYTGKDELRALMADPAGNRRPEFYGHSLHTHVASTHTDIDGDAAVVRSYTVLLQEHGGSVSVVSAASNRWTLARVAGRWLVRERVRRQLATDGFAEALRGTAGQP